MPAVMDLAFAEDFDAGALTFAGFRSPAAAWGPRRTGSPLASLFGDPLGAKFHGWRGASGRRYVCTVFDDPADIRDFAEAVVLGVKRDASGGRVLVDAACTDNSLWPAWLACLAAGRPAAGANEWHVHLVAPTAADRAAALADLREAADGKFGF